MRVVFKTWEEDRPRYMLGKVILHPETPEELAEMDAFRKHIGRFARPRRDDGSRQGSPGDNFEIVFFPKKKADPAAEPAG